MSSWSLNGILIKIPTELFDFIFAGYNLRFILPLVVYICMQRMMHAEFNRIVLFTILYSQFQHCAKEVSKVTAQRTILEYYNKELLR